MLVWTMPGDFLPNIFLVLGWTWKCRCIEPARVYCCICDIWAIAIGRVFVRWDSCLFRVICASSFLWFQIVRISRKMSFVTSRPQISSDNSFSVTPCWARWITMMVPRHSNASRPWWQLIPPNLKVIYDIRMLVEWWNSGCWIRVTLVMCTVRYFFPKKYSRSEID